MSKFSDFDLDIKVVKTPTLGEDYVRSIMFCTPGCPTGIIETCVSQLCYSRITC